VSFETMVSHAMEHGTWKRSDMSPKSNGNNDGENEPEQKKGYQELQIKYKRNQVAYLPAEGLGMSGSFTVRGNIYVKLNRKSKYGYWSARVTAVGETGASKAGDVTFFGDVDLIVDGKVVANYNLAAPTGPRLSAADSSPIGQVEFELPPFYEAVELRINAGYRFKSPEGIALPMPGKSHQKYTIASHK
jgi:hypothetical protein